MNTFNNQIVCGKENTVKIAVRENPKYFNIVITDEKVIQHTKEYLKNATEYNRAEKELLTATLKTIVENPSSLVPVEILFTQDGVVFEYTYNPKYVYESQSRLVLPEIRLKSPIPISISEYFITNCMIYTKSNNESCKYTLTNNVSNIILTKTIPRMEYKKEPLTLNNNLIYIFVDSTGKALIIYPDTFNLQINGKCSVKKITGKNEEYFMYVCSNISYIDFTSLTPGDYKVYITYNKDNTGVFRIDKLSYKIVTYIRPNIIIKRETLEADQLARLYFEKIQGETKNNNKTLIYIGLGAGILIISGIVAYYLKRKNENKDDILW